MPVTLARALTSAFKRVCLRNAFLIWRSPYVVNLTLTLERSSGSSARLRTTLRIFRRPNVTVTCVRVVQTAEQLRYTRSVPFRETFRDGPLTFRSGAVGAPWHRPLPESVKVLPASGTNFQS